jgi:hypothetical protein
MKRVNMVSLLLALALHSALGLMAGAVSSIDYDSIQNALDTNPGTMIEVPAGTHLIEHAIRITAPHSGLYGYGTIVQTNPDVNIVEIVETAGVRLRHVTLTRAEGSQETIKHAIAAYRSREISIEGVRVVDNWSQAGTIMFERCRQSRIADCLVMNYKRLAVDDRTASALYGYAFKVIDGTGILVTHSQGIQILNNRVVENRLFPDEETKTRHGLGALIEGRKPTQKGVLAPPGDYANNWHQGSALVVTSPLETSHVQIRGNYIENAAQGIDIHADHVTCSQNTIKYAFIGIKCMHGSKNVIISENNVSHMDLWGLIMMPGTASHPAEAATEGRAARGANFTSGNIIANNIFSEFGWGHEYFNWKDAGSGVISLESGQLPENPVMTDVIIEGNIVYDSGKDQVLVDGQPKTIPPRYKYAVFISTDPAPRGLRFRNNIFHPGYGGVSNVVVEEQE